MRIHWKYNNQDDGKVIPVTECGYELDGVPAMASFHGHLSEETCRRMLICYRRQDRNA